MLGGVFVVAPDGKIEDLEPEEAARRPELAQTGRIFSDTQARRIQEAYQYKGGLWNAWFVHENQTRITDTETNRQPYLVDFGAAGLGTQWVSVAEPYGRAFAASAIFLTDATTGKTRIWRVPARTSLSGNRRALQAVRAVSIPGIDFGDGAPGAAGSGNFRVVEPRPVFVEGRARLPHVDHPQGGQLGLQDRRRRRRDEQARGDLRQRPRPAGRGQDAHLHQDRRGARRGRGAGRDRRRHGARQATGATTTTPRHDDDARQRRAAGRRPRRAAAARSVERQLDDVIRRQRELLQEIERLRDQVRKGG